MAGEVEDGTVGNGWVLLNCTCDSALHAPPVHFFSQIAPPASLKASQAWSPPPVVEISSEGVWVVAIWVGWENVGFGPAITIVVCHSRPAVSVKRISISGKSPGITVWAAMETT